MTDTIFARRCGFPGASTNGAHHCPWGILGRATGRFFPVIVLMALLAIMPASAQVPIVPTTAPGSLVDADNYIRSDRLGITFIGFIDGNMGAERYRRALILGAGWNRWPLYWDRVERQPGRYDWSAYDRLVAADIHNGLRSNAILLGRPAFWQDGQSVANLFTPIFADGSDSAGHDVPINLNNPWAQYVHYAVTRYRPGGVLARHNDFGAGKGIRAWEIWNEPDVAQFWSGGSEAYARLLKVAAIVIKTVDPDASVIFGGLLYAQNQGFLSQILRRFQSDPLSVRYNWFFDVMAVHAYDDPWRSGWLTKVAQDTLARYGLTRPVWVNETGVSVWNDYPGPVWAYSPDRRNRLATAQQQAHFLIMSAAFAWSKGVDVVMYHQLYDDCGNYPAGTDFPPHHGELCANGACYGDAFGIYRNPRDAHCFSHHPLANTPRPVAQAFRLLAEVFGRVDFAPVSLTGLKEVSTSIVFQRSSGERIHVLWNNTAAPRSQSLKATAAAATVYFMNGESMTLPAVNGVYMVELKPATDYYFPDLESDRSSAIGGEPIILVESPNS
ncbi:MAG: hypothetical protein OXI34_17950 [Chloroflexota bacterium]|nr:hypothetical protein [Chloroflexota bacterium]MDE2945936.1 hypothetical protein [Chloroflexota bacterium]